MGPRRAGGRALGWPGVDRSQRAHRPAPVVAGLTALVCLVLSAGCETFPSRSLGPPISAEQRRAATRLDDDAFAAIGYRRDWTAFPVVTRGQRIEQLTPAGDVVLVLEGGSTVTALERSNGAQRWANPLANPLTVFVGLDRVGDRVLCSAESDAYQLNIATGQLEARQTFARIVSTPPVVVGRLAIYGTWVGELLAHDLVSGVTAWGNAIWGDAPPGAIERRPVLVGDAVGVVSRNGEVFFADALTGSELGRNRIYGRVATDPVAVDSLMVVASLDQSVYAFSSYGGSQVWRHRTAVPLVHQPVAHGRRVYVTIPGEGLVAFGVDDGRVLWRAGQVEGTVVAVRTGRLVVWDGTTATLVDPATGDAAGRAALPQVRALVAEQFEDGALYAITEHEVVVRLVPR